MALGQQSQLSSDPINTLNMVRTGVSALDDTIEDNQKGEPLVLLTLTFLRLIEEYIISLDPPPHPFSNTP